MDNNLNDFFFVSNKIIFILLVILYFQIYKHYIFMYEFGEILIRI